MAQQRRLGEASYLHQKIFTQGLENEAVPSIFKSLDCTQCDRGQDWLVESYSQIQSLGKALMVDQSSHFVHCTSEKLALLAGRLCKDCRTSAHFVVSCACLGLSGQRH